MIHQSLLSQFTGLACLIVISQCRRPLVFQKFATRALMFYYMFSLMREILTWKSQGMLLCCILCCASDATATSQHCVHH